MAGAVAEARGEVVEVPETLREVRSAAESMVLDAAGFSAVSALFSIDYAFGQRLFDSLGITGWKAAVLLLLAWGWTVSLVVSRFFFLISGVKTQII